MLRVCERESECMLRMNVVQDEHNFMITNSPHAKSLAAY